MQNYARLSEIDFSILDADKTWDLGLHILDYSK